MTRILAIAALLFTTACAVQQSAPAPSAPASAAIETYLGAGVTYLPDNRAIGMTGRITDDTDDVFIAALRNDPGIDTVVLMDHQGGLVIPAHRIGTFIRARGMATVVAGFCASACVDILVAGSYRVSAPGAMIGLHAPSEVSDYGMRIDARYYTAMGVPQMFSMTYAVPHEDMLWIDARTALAYNLIDIIAE